MTRPAAALAPFLLALSLIAGPALADPSGAVTHSLYSCAGNETLDVVYVTPDSGDSYAVVLEEDELLPMVQVRSASGAVYEPVSRDYQYQLATKGNEATLYATTDGKEEAVKSDCKTSG
ncbi:MliC family protein [Paracoccus contaminans]|uniref:C-type lysozyme inhibitor domain-containing protein n=1 Tax=Paracoccus contaminans TaxID=1945662 RepID=A0A1W6CVT0_9RHOB|nr:MliC family protein [Paracoccus contaminans]ARJ68889.1 hypothetical protein B0A89_03825 [Paracoccus contaminans]